MNIFNYIKLKWNEYWIWFKRSWQGDVRPEAVKPVKRKPQPKKQPTKQPTKRKTK